MMKAARVAGWSLIAVTILLGFPFIATWCTLNGHPWVMGPAILFGGIAVSAICIHAVKDIK